MVAEEVLNTLESRYIPQMSITGSKTVACIIKSFIKTVPFFKACLLPEYLQNLNEDKYTQILVEQIDIQLRTLSYPLGVKNQYHDIHYGGRGISDFYFHPLEEGRYTGSLFSVEAKRLPLPALPREKEYVIGTNHNGGIERYKLEIHGKGLLDCGLVGYIENESFEHWKDSINNWINELSEGTPGWEETELLDEINTQLEYSQLISIVLRKTESKLNLHHFWIRL